MDWALPFPCVFSLTKQPKLSFRETILPVRDVPSPAFASQKPHFGQSLSSARTSNGNGRGRPLQKRTSSPVGRTSKGPDQNKELSDERRSNPSKSNQEEIISLFKRIQSSISQGKSSNVEERKKNVGSSEDEPVTEVLLDVIRRSRKQTEGDTSARKDQEGSFMRPKGEVRRARPPSNFTKRSPIPPPLGPRGKLLVPNGGEELGETAEKEAEKALVLESMKLVKLKELAKTRGIKGYSKLKKSELVELLRSSSSTS